MECVCEVRILRIYDPSGNEREELPVGVQGWTFHTEVSKDPRTYNHQFKCPKSREAPELMTMEAFYQYMKEHSKIDRSHAGNGTYSGAHAFTLTKSPKDSQTVSDMLAAVRKIVGQKSCKVKRYAWYLEYKGTDEAGLPAHPHIHGMYETESGGRIETRHFKRAWPIWDPSVKLGMGFRGGYHRPIKDSESYEEYIAKDGGIGERSE